MDSDEVRKRKEYAERKVKERHAALRKEAEERRKHTVEHRERVQSQLKREQVLLQKRMQQLNEDEERKKTTLAKQHEATSRIAAITKSPKSFAFGSSTPRTLAYLDNLPKSEQQYDKKLRPPEGPAPISSPLATSPTAKTARLMTTPTRAPPAAHKPAPTMTSMTSSMYVTSSAPPTRHAKASIKPATAAPSKRISQGTPLMMTQSVYTPTSRPATSRLSSARQNRGSTPTSTRATPPAPPAASSRRSLNVQKPPAPRKTVPNAKPEVKKEVAPVLEAPVTEKSPSPVAESVVEAAQPFIEEYVATHTVAPIAEETPAEKVDLTNEEELVKVDDETPREIEKTEIVPEVLSIETYEPVVEKPGVGEVVEQEVGVPVPDVDVDVVDAVPKEEGVPEVEEKIVVPPENPIVETHVEIPAPEDHEEEKEITLTSEESKDELISLAHETSESNVGSSVNTSLADELGESGVEQRELVEPSRPEVVELKYPIAEEAHVAAANAVNDLVDVFGNDFIDENPPQRIIDFDEDADSGKASPTSSETSSTTDEVTPRSVIEEVKAAAPRVLPLVRSAEDIAKKEKEARETEERRTRLAEILAKTRGMASPVTNTLPPPPASIAKTGGASDVLARVAAKTNLPSLQKILQRKQGSNPSLQTSESTGGEIY